jgi:hypothetical protein
MITKEKIKDILLIGTYMGIKNLFSYETKQIIYGVYIAEDEEGTIDYVDVGINWFSPESDWNILMNVCEKIIKENPNSKKELYSSINEFDREKTFNICVELIKK